MKMINEANEVLSASIIAGEQKQRDGNTNRKKKPA